MYMAISAMPGVWTLLVENFVDIIAMPFSPVG